MISFIMGDTEGNKLIHHHLGLQGLFQQLKIASHKKETKGEIKISNQIHKLEAHVNNDYEWCYFFYYSSNHLTVSNKSGHLILFS